MAQTVEELAELLNNLKVQNEHNAEGFEKVLTIINNKLDMMADDTEASDSIKIYISELKKVVEDKHSYTISMFNGIEHSIANILEVEKDSAKSSQIQELFQNLTSNINNFSADIISQKELIEKIDDRVEILRNDKSDKNEVLNTIADVGKALQTANADISKSFDSLNAGINEVINSLLSLDISQHNENIKQELELLKSNSNEVLDVLREQEAKTFDITNLIHSLSSQFNLDDISSKIDRYSEALDELKYIVSGISGENNTFVAEQFQKLEKELSTIVTDSDFAGFRKDLGDFVQQIIDNSKALSKDLNYSTERIENILATVNSIDFSSDFAAISVKFGNSLNELKDFFRETASSNYISLSSNIEALKNVITDSTNASNNFVYEELEKLEKSFSNIVTDSDFSGFKQDLSDFVKKIIDNSNALSLDLNINAERIENILSTVQAIDFSDNFNEVSGKLVDLKNIYTENSAIVGNMINDGFSKLEKDFDDIVNSSDFEAFKEEFSGVVHNIIESNAAFNNELNKNTERMKNILSAVDNIDFSNNFSDLSDKIDELKTIFSSNSDINYNRLLESIEAVKGLVVENSSTTSNMIYDEFEKLEKALANIVTDSDFARFKKDLADFVQKIIDNSNALNSELTNTAQRIENIFSTVKSIDFQEDFANVEFRINELKKSFEDGAKLNYDNLSKEITSLSDRLLISFDNFDSNSKETAESIYERLASLKEDLNSRSDNNEQAVKEALNVMVGVLQSAKDDLTVRIENASFDNVQGLSKIESLIDGVSVQLGNIQSEIFNKDAELRPEDILASIDEASSAFTTQLTFAKKHVESDYKDIKADIAELASKTEALSVEFKQLASSDLENTSKVLVNAEEISSKIEELKSILQNMQETDNSADLLINLDDVSSKIDDLSKEFGEVTGENASKILTNIDNISSQIEIMQNNISQDVSENVSSISADINSLTAKIDDLKTDLQQLSETDNTTDLLINLEDVSSKIDDLSKLFSETSNSNASEILANISNISTQIENIMENIKQNINVSNSTIDSNINALVNMVEEVRTAIGNLDPNKNDEDIILSLDNVSSKVDLLSDSFLNTSAENFSKIKDLINELSADFEKQKDEWNNENKLSNEEKFAKLQLLADGINNLQEYLNTANNEYKTVIEDRISGLKSYVSEIGDSLYSSATESCSKIDEKLAVLSDLSHGFEASLIDVNVNLQNIIKNLMTMDVTEQNDIIKRELENIYISANAVLSSLKISDQKNDEIAEMIAGLADKHDYEALQNRFDEIIARAQELSANIASLPTKLDFAEITNKFSSFSNTISELKDIVKNSFDANNVLVEEQITKFEAAFEKVITEEDFAQFRFEFTEFIQKILDNSTVLNFNSEENKNKIADILEKLNVLNYTSDFENIASRINDFRDCFENNSKMNYENLSQEIVMLSERFQKCFDSLDADSKESFTSLKDDIDNVFSVVKDLSETSSQKSIELLTGISSDLHATLSELEGKLNENVNGNFEDLKSIIDKMIDELNLVKEDFVQKSDAGVYNITAGFDTFRTSIDALTASFEGLKAELIQNNNSSLSRVSDVFHDIYEKTVTLINSMEEKSCEDAETLQESIQDLALKFSVLEQAFKETSVSHSDLLLSEIKEVSQGINDIKTELMQYTAESIGKLSDNIETAALKIDNIQDNLALEVANSLADFKEMFNNLSNDISTIKDTSSDKLNENHFQQMDKLDVISADLKILESTLNDSAHDYNNHIDEALESLRNYITEINVAAKSAKSLSESKFAEKLLSIEALITHSSSDYDEKINILQSKLGDYIQAVEAANSEADLKLENSIAEISAIKYELTALSDSLKANFEGSDEKAVQILSLLETGVQSVSESIAGINTSVQSGINISLKENLTSIDDKFDNLLSLFDVFKSDSDSSKQSILNELEDKISLLKQELNLVNTDISSALEIKTEEIIRGFEPIKEEINNLLSSDFGKILTDIKEQLDLSYINTSADIKAGFADNQESFAALEQAYKETVNKISEIEDCLKEQTQENLELIKLAVENVNKNVDINIDKTNSFVNEWHNGIEQIKEKLLAASENYNDSLSILKEDIQNVVDDKLNLYIEDLKAHIGVTLNTDDTMLAIDALKHELSDKFSALLIEFAARNEKADAVKENINSIREILKEYIQQESQKTLDKILNLEKTYSCNEKYLKDSNEALQTLHQKLDILVTSQDIEPDYTETIDALHQKIDMLVTSQDSEPDYTETIDALHQKLDILVTSQEHEDDPYAEAFETLNSKIDVIASDTSVMDLSDKVDDMAIAEDKIAETLMALHQKVDTLALFNDSEDFDAQTEIEDIKNLILEQRKYFENSETNEKTEAINSCLEELFSKIQNIENGLSDVDLEKNTQDIKESIMAAIISVFEQVSFVEETEEIKDFVEEKTDEINQHLQEVREQLKQIASSNDGFDYSYTLQDVESDIAKLRIALNDISNSTSKDDINDLSRNINKIALSVEGLQSSLTPDQMFDLKEDIEKLNDDIISISSRTNKLLLTSDESYKALSSGLDRFSNVVSNLEEKISYIDNSEVNQRFEKKIDAIKSMVTSSVNADKVFHQVLMYLGEWIDATSENISSITEKAAEIDRVKAMIEELKEAVPDKKDILSELEEKFENQESRIDRLEMKIERILSTLEEKDDMVLNNKVDKIEKQLSRLSANIEKLASYVDEE